MRIFQFAFACLCVSIVTAQNYNFTWANGTNTTGAGPVVTSTGVPSASNCPGSRGMMGTWKDNNGNFWMFGGFGLGYGHASDLWKFDPNINQWTLIKAGITSTQTPTYGTKGVPSPSNQPGGRSRVTSWTDKNGDFWMFGGEGSDINKNPGILDDLWKYSVGTNEWTWMSGSPYWNQFTVYGIKGVPSPTNMPGSRQDAAGWVDNNGDLWLFGGFGYTVTGFPTYLNDTWKYSVSSGQWTWMSGSNVGYQNGSYGSMGVPSTTNCPGGRTEVCAWTDNNGGFWMFGGGGCAASGFLGSLNDLWYYDTNNNTWKWVNGSSTLNPLGNYVNTNTAMPGGRSDAMTWTDSHHNIWMYGGYGFGSAPGSDYLSDLWRYDPGNNTWKWMRGPNTVSQTAVYGTKGVTTVSNTPGGRGNSATWIDGNDNLWLFGGFGYGTTISTQGYLNDVWKTCFEQTITVVPGSPTLCSGSTITLTASGATTFTWSGGQTQSSIVVTPSVNTTFTVASADVGSCGDFNAFGVQVFSKPTITASSTSTLACVGESVTLSASGANSFTWSTGDNGSSITLLADDMTYTVTGVDFNGCMGMTTVVQTTSECTGIPSQQQSMISIFPNPSSGVLQIKSDRNEPMDVIVSDLSGRVMRSYPNYTQGMMLSTGLEKGIYFVRTSGGTEKVMEVSWKWVVE